MCWVGLPPESGSYDAKLGKLYLRVFDTLYSSHITLLRDTLLNPAHLPFLCSLLLHRFYDDEIAFPSLEILKPTPL
jgi:hypothetical protein